MGTLQLKPLLLTATTDQMIKLKYLKCSSARLYIYDFNISELSKTEQLAETWHQPIVIAEIWNLLYKTNNVMDY